MSGALLIDVDSIIPNLALMHISTWRKSLGIDTGFNISDPDEVWASIVYNKNRHLADGLKSIYPNARIDIGGSGYNLDKNLPEEVDLMMPDYSLYPKCDYDLGFTSRGCARHCHFCIVPRKEGKFRRSQHPREFHIPNHKKIVLMDNNILLDTDWFFEVTDWILKCGLSVDFNQGLDIRLLSPDVAERLAKLTPISTWHFAFDSLNYRDSVERGIAMLRGAGVDVRHRAIFYVYLGSDSQFRDAYDRCMLLRNWGTSAFLMIDPTAKRTQRMTDLKRWCIPQLFWSTTLEDYQKARGDKA